MPEERSLKDLITEYYEEETARKMYAESAGRLKAEIIQALHRDGATKFFHPDFEVKLIPGKITPDMNEILPLLESPLADKLIDSGAIIPAHTETKEVPTSVNYQQLNPFRDNGTIYAKAIKKSKIRNDPRLSVTPKKSRGGESNESTTERGDN